MVSHELDSLSSPEVLLGLADQVTKCYWSPGSRNDIFNLRASDSSLCVSFPAVNHGQSPFSILHKRARFLQAASRSTPSVQTRSENSSRFGDFTDIRHKRLAIRTIFVQMVPLMEWSDDLTQLRLKCENISDFLNQISLISNRCNFQQIA